MAPYGHRRAGEAPLDPGPAPAPAAADTGGEGEQVGWSCSFSAQNWGLRNKFLFALSLSPVTLPGPIGHRSPISSQR